MKYLSLITHIYIRRSLLVILLAAVVVGGSLEAWHYGTQYVVFKKQHDAALASTLSAQEQSLETLQNKVSALEAELGGVHGAIAATEADTSKMNQTLVDTQKSLQSEQKKTADLAVQASKLKTIDVSSVVNEWRPRIAEVRCYWNSGLESQGSGLFIGLTSGKYEVVTNRHVVFQDSTAAACTVQLPGDSEVSASGILYSQSANADSATMYIDNPSSIMNSLSTSVADRMCATKASVGDPLVVLGYPAIGSPQGITATEGIVSGYDGNYYITSAKIEQGNSGGVAISLKDNCDLGIPTLVEVGKVESLGRILDWHQLRI